MIVGAGLAGLIAAHAFPRSRILEAMPEPQEMHKALLRFRTTSVAELTGIEFKAVNVKKGIWHEGEFKSPNIRLCNMYSQKCIGKIIDRSIWDLEPVTRYIAPMDFYERLIDAVGHRIHWNTPFKAEHRTTNNPVISTAPMQIMMKEHDLAWGGEFERAPIHVKRFDIINTNVYQTVYFPTAEHSLYRASITGDLIICEFSGEPEGRWEADMLHAFGVLDADDIEVIDEGHQNFGKIAPIQEDIRKWVINTLTDEHNVYSLGRFATWRNILLDDVVKDIAVVKRLINATKYERKLER